MGRRKVGEGSKKAWEKYALGGTTKEEDEGGQKSCCPEGRRTKGVGQEE